MERHMVAKHNPEAEKMGLDVSKCRCPECGMEFDNIRKDRLIKHRRKKHGYSSQIPL